MSGETDLPTLIKNMRPEMDPNNYVFCSITGAQYGSHAALQPLASFHEKEGLTLVLLKEQADRMDFSYQGVFCCITLRIHSSLEAVGLTSTVSSRLADAGISVNMIAAFFHDHLFVPAERANDAMRLLQELGQ